jgi:hypothetical protein
MPYNSELLTALGHQLIVRAELHKSRPVEHEDEIGHVDCREPVVQDSSVKIIVTFSNSEGIN